ncbi:MAG: hypothetical protein ETSY1_07540 [Candidatus Entotheonella factor]|uniref:Uncharacterized protein n=1 Tax=Entotheonella factor TaxID=1429438 RepID=W4LU76_ENTF1|nr:hypothetical protein [Candidatus Entotheonella palauensis]ETX01410.1 MAG: hypothetical protein ETSY1_07540 [Candidatus Entotheonella factor]
MVTAAGTVVGKGAVGENGPTAIVNYTVKAETEIMMLVKTVDTSLCPNTGAFALMFKNGMLVAHGVITDEGASIQNAADPGDDIVVYVATFPIPNEIVCVRLGDLSFNVIQQDLVASARR